MIYENLRDYPQKIEAESLEMIRLNERLGDYRRAVEVINDGLTQDVLFAIDEATRKPLFTNQEQRTTVIRDRQREHQSLQSLLVNIGAAEESKATITARLERLRGEFSILKIEAQIFGNFERTASERVKGMPALQ